MAASGVDLQLHGFLLIVDRLIHRLRIVLVDQTAPCVDAILLLAVADNLLGLLGGVEYEDPVQGPAQGVVLYAVLALPVLGLGGLRVGRVHDAGGCHVHLLLAILVPGFRIKDGRKL